MGADLFYDDGRIEMTRIIVAFFNFTKASKKNEKFGALSKKKFNLVNQKPFVF
jgi:hypothetical protein